MSSSVIYFIRRESDGLVKIGTTTQLKQRLAAIAKDVGSINLMGVIVGGAVREKLLHWIFKGQRIKGEWFTLTPEIEELVAEYATVPAPKLTRVASAADVNKIPLQTYLSSEEVEALARVEVALGVTRAPGRPSPTGLMNVKRALALSVLVADWILSAGARPPSELVEETPDE